MLHGKDECVLRMTAKQAATARNEQTKHSGRRNKEQSQLRCPIECARFTLQNVLSKRGVTHVTEGSPH